MTRHRWTELGWRSCLLAAAIGAAHCSSSDDRSTTGTGRGGASTGSVGAGGAGTGGGNGGASATGGSGGSSGGSGGTAGTAGKGGTGGSAGTGVTGGTGGTTGGSGGTGGASGAGGKGGAAGTSGTGGTAGTTGTGGTAGTSGTGGTAGTGGSAGTGGTAGKGGAAGTTDAGSPKDAGGADATVDTTTPPVVCGDASTTGVPFPQLTTYTGNDGGFGYVTSRNSGDATSGPVAIFRPSKYGQGGVKHPIVVWGNGSTNTVDIWQSFLQRVASYGFLVVAPEQTMVTAAQMNAAIDYAIRLAGDASGNDCGKIDTTKIGATGYSLGGMGAIQVGSHARINATFVLCSTSGGSGGVNAIKAPWAGVFAEDDQYFAWSTVKTNITGSTQPAFGAMFTGGNHNSTPGQAKSSEAYIGFLRWRLMGDTAGHDMFVGPSCKICSDTAFGEVAKTGTWDSL